MDKQFIDGRQSVPHGEFFNILLLGTYVHHTAPILCIPLLVISRQVTIFS